jgi:predicted aminopeptidase
MDGDFVAYLVSASPKDELVAYQWRFPLVGSFPYKGFFQWEDANEEILALKESGYDTHLSGAVAFSALGWFSDPLYSSMLRTNEMDLIYTILHEMVHGTVFFPDHVDFNEQLATFVGWHGTIAFMEKVHGEDSSQARMARLVVEDEKRLGEFLHWAHDKLTRYYARPMTFEEKVAGRSEVFNEIQAEFQRRFKALENPRISVLDDMVWNNASLLMFWRYRYDAGDLEALYLHLKNDLNAMMALMVTWRKSGQDPQVAIKQILADRKAA